MYFGLEKKHTLMASCVDVIKAGCSGCCSIIFLLLGVLLSFVGLPILLIGIFEAGEDNDDVYEQQNR